MLSSYEYVYCLHGTSACPLIVNSFAALTTHLKALADEAAEAAAAKMDNLSVKGKSKAKTKEEKDAAVASEKKRKATVSHGVQQLKKVNTRGMAKLSSFFQPKASA